MRKKSLLITALFLPMMACSASEAASDEIAESAEAGSVSSGANPEDEAGLAAGTGSASGASASAARTNATDAQDIPDELLFRAAGFTQTARGWEKCEDPGSLGYAPGEVAQRGDFNGDGRPDAVIYEGSTACAGMTGNVYTLLSQQADGSWKIIDESIGIPRFLTTKGAGGWPDIEVGGPGFCFPVVRWNGSEYALDRQEYEGKPCS